MAGKQKLTGKLAVEALKKFPNSSKKSIAKYLFEKYPAVFNSPEHARQTIKGYTTESSGIVEAKKIKHVTQFSTENPFGLPESQANERQFHDLPSSCTNVVWLSDIHFPNQDNKALTAALKYAKAHSVNCIVLGGDILDNTPFTSHLAPPPGPQDVRNHFQMVSDFLDMLKREFNCPIYWLEGNHDNWYQRYLMSKAPMIFEDPYYALEQRLGLSQRGIVFLKQHIILRAGKLQLAHGHTLIRGIFSPVNPARGVFLRTKSSTIIGHVHQNSYHPERNLKGEIIGCWSVGCLCTLAPDYDPHNTKHGQGFAHITIEHNGDFNVELKEIFNGKIL